MKTYLIHGEHWKAANYWWKEGSSCKYLSSHLSRNTTELTCSFFVGTYVKTHACPVGCTAVMPNPGVCLWPWSLREAWVPASARFTCSPGGGTLGVWSVSWGLSLSSVASGLCSPWLRYFPESHFQYLKNGRNNKPAIHLLTWQILLLYGCAWYCGRFCKK